MFVQLILLYSVSCGLSNYQEILPYINKTLDLSYKSY
jgi:hypothetical protein